MHVIAECLRRGQYQRGQWHLSCADASSNAIARADANANADADADADGAWVCANF